MGNSQNMENSKIYKRVMLDTFRACFSIPIDLLLLHTLPIELLFVHTLPVELIFFLSIIYPLNYFTRFHLGPL